MTDFDINEEYFIIHGPEHRDRLFCEQEYEELRRELKMGLLEYPSIQDCILQSQSRPLSKQKNDSPDPLPFDNINLIPYIDYRFSDSVLDAKRRGIDLYYLKEVTDGKISVRAAGYVSGNDHKFNVIPYSFFRKNAYSESLWSDLPSKEREKVIKHYSIQGDRIIEITTHQYESASLAASCLLGKKSSFVVWADENGRGLSDTFLYYGSKCIFLNEEKTFPSYGRKSILAQLIHSLYLKKLNNPASNIFNGSIDELIPNHSPHQKTFKLKKTTKKTTSAHIKNDGDSLHEYDPSFDHTSSLAHIANQQHYFYIRDIFGCDAKGFYDTEKKVFYVCKDSIIVDGGFTSDKRSRFLNNACTQFQDGLRKVIKDAKCMTATAAAYYVTGRKIDYTAWMDSNGKLLKDYYPQQFPLGGKLGVEFIKPNLADKSKDIPVIQSSQTRTKIFQLEWDAGCFATGSYNPQTYEFTVFDGSLIVLECNLSYSNSSSSISRKQIVLQSCIREEKGYRLTKSQKFKGPNIAASFVLGRVANGVSLWKDENGISLKNTEEFKHLERSKNDKYQ